MGEVVPISPTAARLMECREAELPGWNRAVAAKRLAELRPLLDDIAAGKPKGQAMEKWAARTGQSVKTARRRIKAWQEQGLEGLASGDRGRKADLKGLEGVILRLYNMPSRPNCGTIACWIKDETGVELSPGQIRRFVKKLPAVAAEQSPRRMGRHTYDLTVRPHIERDAGQFKFGEAVVSDGHCMKIWCLHPVTGKPFRAEFTPILDIRSNFMFTFWLSEAESADTTVFALCALIAEYHHAPVIFYTDPGPGFKNKRVKALLDKIGTTHMVARGGNARGKGFGEGFFRLFIEREAKRYASCCSRDRTDDLMARFLTKWKHGEVHVPRFEEVFRDLLEVRDRYNRRPQPYSKRLRGKAPIDFKHGWTPSGIEVPVHELIRPTKELTVRGGAVRTMRRRYVHPDLLGYEKRKVEVESEIFDPTRVYVWSRDGRFVCEALCEEARPYMPATLLEEARAKSDAAKIALHGRHVEEIRARSRRVISPAHIGEDLGDDAAKLGDAATRLIEQGHHVETPRAKTHPRREIPISDEQLAELRARAEAEEQEEEETDTADDRIRWALALEARVEAGEELAEEDARRLTLYQSSPEYHSRKALLDEFGGEEE